MSCRTQQKELVHAQNRLYLSCSEWLQKKLELRKPTFKDDKCASVKLRQSKMWTLTHPGWALPVHGESLDLELPALPLPPRSLLSTSARWRRCTDNSSEMNWFFSSFSYSSSSRRANSSTSSSDNSLTRLSISSYNSHSPALDMFSMPATSHSIQTLSRPVCDNDSILT